MGIIVFTILSSTTLAVNKYKENITNGSTIYLKNARAIAGIKGGVGDLGLPGARGATGQFLTG